jgi:surfeit locus 1 family protein
MLLRLLFNRKWWWTTLLVIAAMGVMIRLGIWQLDRLEQRRAFNSHLVSVQAMPPLELTAQTLAEPLETMEYRAIIVTGEYDMENQVALRNQAWYGRPGYTLLTPLKIAGTDMAILVNRGWVSSTDYTPGGDQTYPAQGFVTVTGIVRHSQSEPDFGRRTDPTPQAGEFLPAWNFANVEAIADQISYPILPVYIQRGPDSSLPADFNDWTDEHLPFPALPELEITEGPHLGYAIQWFIFASILGLGYPVFLAGEGKNSKV